MNRFSTLRVILLAAYLVFITGLQTAFGAVENGTLWRDAAVTQLDVDFGETGFHARWNFHRCSCGDLQVQVEQVAPDGVLTGELLMVGGKVLLARGFKQQGADIEPLIQAPSLMLQLAFELLNRAQPLGPYDVGQQQQWSVAEETVALKLDTGLATGNFAAPWSVTGSAWATAAGHRRFELVFKFDNTPPGQASETSSLTLSGNLDFGKKDFPYPGSTDFGGWQIQWISHNDRESELVPEGLTLKELRLQTD